MGLRVETELGRLQGFEDSGLEVFLGIPYAAPPTGPLRFRAPRPAAPWSGVRDATRFGASAPQVAADLEAVMPGMDVGPQSEDCLFLNVYTPRADAGRRPVLVWIHGGAFTIGSGSQKMYDVRRLAREGDVVVVTLNYRLGALGFLHLAGLDPSLDARGNAGILDQVAALAWVRDHIASFGGDPGSVTIFGESAGGMSVGTLLGLPAARGLFHRAIPQSGAAHSVNGANAGTQVAEAFLGELGLSRRELARLWQAPVEDILAAQQRCELRLAMPTRLRAFRPLVDGRDLPERPIDAIAGGLSAGVPVLVGACRDEEKLFTLWDPEARRLDEAALVKRIDARQPGRGEHLVRSYRAARAARGADTSPYELYCAIETDRIFRMPAVRLAEAQCRHEPRTFAYLVTWEAQAMGGKLGACHGIDLPFVFGQIGTKAGGLFAGAGPEAERLSREMMGAWLAFAHNGAPRHTLLSDWAAYDEENRPTMIFGRETHLDFAPFEAERAAWAGIL